MDSFFNLRSSRLSLREAYTESTLCTFSYPTKRIQYFLAVQVTWPLHFWFGDITLSNGFYLLDLLSELLIVYQISTKIVLSCDWGLQTSSHFSVLVKSKRVPRFNLLLLRWEIVVHFFL